MSQLDPRTTRHDQPRATIVDVLAYIQATRNIDPKYEVWALMQDGEQLCPTCVIQNAREVLGAFTHQDAQWLIIGWVAPADLEPDTACAHCHNEK